MEMARENERRIAVVDLLRTISILLVMGSHYQFVSNNFHAPVGFNASPDNYIWQHLHNGALGVSLFFLVSGFVITRSTLLREKEPAKVSTSAFYLRRAARILPLFFLMLAISGNVFHWCDDGSVRFQVCFADPGGERDLMFWVSLITFSFNWLHVLRHCVFGLQWDICWSLSIEEQFYVLFPLVMRRLKTRSALIFPLLVIFFCGTPIRWYLRTRFPDSPWPAWHNSLSSFDLIALGVLLFLLVERTTPFLESRRYLYTAICGLGAVLMIVALDQLPLSLVYGPAWLGIGAFLFVLGGIHMAPLNRIPAILLLPGELSYGCYLLHPLVLYLLWEQLEKLPAWLGFTYFLVTTLVIGFVSYHWFESPLNKYLRGWGGLIK